METENQIFYYLIGIIVILFNALITYSTPGKNHSLKFIPKSNRNLTTTYRFYLIFSLYVFILLGVYSFLCVTMYYAPGAISSISNVDVTGLTTKFPMPIAAALIIILGLRSTPKVKSFHENLLTKLWDMGAIPTQALTISEQMGKCAYRFSAGIRKEVGKFATANGIDPEKINFDAQDSRSFEWAQTQSLICQIERWESMKGFGLFIKTHLAGFEDIKKHYVIVTDLFKRYQRHSANLDKATGVPDTLNILKELDNQLEKTNQNLIRRICQFIAMAMLTCSSEKDQAKEIKKLGFVYMNIPPSAPPLPIKKIILILFSIFCTTSLLTHLNSAVTSSKIGKLTLIEIATQMTLMYSVAIILCILVLRKTRALIIERETENLIADSLITAFAATACSYLFIVTFQSFSLCMIKNEAPVFLQLKVNTYHWPYLFQVFLLSIGLLYMCNRVVVYQKDKVIKERTIDAVWVGLSTGIGGIACFMGKYEIGFAPDPRTLERFANDSSILGPYLFGVWFFLKAFILGAIAGYIVPSIYRKNMVKAPEAILNRNIRDDIETLTAELRSFSNQEISEALSTTCAYVASADGHVGEKEKLLCKKLIEYFKENKIAEISYSTFSKSFDSCCQKFSESASTLSDNLQGMLTLKKFSESTVIKTVLVLLCISVASADGSICKEEKSAIKDIATHLQLDTNIDDLVSKAATRES